MKKTVIQFFSTIFFCAMAVMLFAQIEEGYLMLEITEVNSDNQQAAAQLEMMVGSTIAVNFKGSESVTKANMMGGMIETNIKMSENGNMDMLMSMMGNKIWVTATKAELDLAQAQSDNGMDDLDIEYDESDTKNIAGFDCYKMIVTNPASENFLIEAYITEEIKTNAAMIQGVDLSQFKGLPLEYAVSSPIPGAGGTMTMTFSAQDFSPEVDESVFALNTDGYAQKTWEEFIAMSGGFGF